MWSSSAHMVQAHRGRIESTRIASPSTALAPLTCPLPQASRLHHVIPQKVFTLSHTPHPRVTQHLGIDIGDAYGVRYQRCSTRGTFCSIRNLPGRAWFRQGFRSTSAAVPTTPTSNHNACQFPLLPLNPRELHILDPILRPIVYCCRIQTLSDFPKAGGRRGKNWSQNRQWS
jgi:hypothetical protein